MENSDTVKLALTWSEKKVFDGKSFDDQIVLEKIPLGWFYKKFFLPNVIPKYVNPTPFVCMKKKLNLLRRAYFSFNARVLPLLLLAKEKRKMKKAYAIQADASQKVLFLSYSSHRQKDGKLFRIQNIIDDIKADKRFTPFVLFSEPLSSHAVAENTIYNYLDGTTVDKARAESKRLHQEIMQLSTDSLSKAFSINGTVVFNEYRAVCTMYFSKRFLLVLILTYELCKTLLSTEKIHAIVLTSANSLIERCLIAAASKKNIPVIVIQHGIGMGRLIDRRMPVHFAVFGDFHAQQLIRNGALPEYVHKVGPVIFDDIIGYKSRPTKRVLIATAPLVEDNECTKKEYFSKVEKVLKDIAEISGISIVLKLHPREKYKNEYEKIIARNRLGITFCGQVREEFYRLMGGCGSFVHFGTTAALEAMILNRPVVTIHMRDADIPQPILWLKDASIFLSYNGDIKSAVLRSLSDEKELQLKRQKYIQQFCGEVDGMSHRRTAQLVYSLENNHKQPASYING
ncbi:MAG TPA: hypothetical protein VJH88_00155 [Candidatus Nanoarchaeia archaeon]|nr:hypothetical protein [Candidatus Nanoarchaeia archaeon]